MLKARGICLYKICVGVGVGFWNGGASASDVCLPGETEEWKSINLSANILGVDSIFLFQVTWMIIRNSKSRISNRCGFLVDSVEIFKRNYNELRREPSYDCLQIKILSSGGNIGSINYWRENIGSVKFPFIVFCLFFWNKEIKHGLP